MQRLCLTSFVQSLIERHEQSSLLPRVASTRVLLSSHSLRMRFTVCGETECGPPVAQAREGVFSQCSKSLVLLFRRQEGLQGESCRVQLLCAWAVVAICQCFGLSNQRSRLSPSKSRNWRRQELRLCAAHLCRCVTVFAWSD